MEREKWKNRVTEREKYTQRDVYTVMCGIHKHGNCYEVCVLH